MQATLKLLDIARGRRETTNEEKSNKSNFFFNYTFILLYLYYNLFIWRVLGNAVIKHQGAYRYALVLTRSYFDAKYLEIGYNISHKF